MQRERLLALAAVALSVTTALAQRPEFDVASVKVNTTDGDMDLKPHRSGDLVIMHNTQLYAMIFYAYHLTDNYQLTGFVPFSPNETNWFDVEARIGREATDDEVRLMFQSLIEERFKVKMHRETREMPVYELTLGKGKPRLTPSGQDPMRVTIEGRHFNQPAGTCSRSAWLEGTHFTCHAAGVEAMLSSVRSELHAPVVDRTGLTGTYDLDFRYLEDSARPRPEAEGAPSFLQAFRYETGLNLEKGKGPVEIWVIDHMEKPSAN